MRRFAGSVVTAFVHLGRLEPGFPRISTGVSRFSSRSPQSLGPSSGPAMGKGKGKGGGYPWWQWLERIIDIKDIWLMFLWFIILYNFWPALTAGILFWVDSFGALGRGRRALEKVFSMRKIILRRVDGCCMLLSSAPSAFSRHIKPKDGDGASYGGGSIDVK